MGTGTDTDKIARLETDLAHTSAHSFENETQQKMLGDRLIRVEERVEERMDRMDAKIDALTAGQAEIKAQLTTVIKPFWQDPKVIVAGIALMIGAATFSGSLFHGATPQQAAQQAAQVVTTLDPTIQALIQALGDKGSASGGSGIAPQDVPALAPHPASGHPPR
jgi:uncharacterized protein YyaL (SSP411 family)